MRLVASLTDNPVLVKELRTRMRGARAYWILTGYLAFLSFILFLMYVQWWSEVSRSGGMATGSKIGQTFFWAIAGVQGFLVAFITPAITSGAITIEREQRTMEMLTMTRMSRGSIIAGKLFSAVSFIALLLVSSLPLTSICFLLGGVSPEQVANAYALLLAGAFIAGSLGLAWSSVAKTTAAAVIMTYGTLLGPPLLLMLALGLGASGLFAGGSPGTAVTGAGLSALYVAGLFGIPATSVVSSSSMNGFWGPVLCFGVQIPVWLAPVLTYALLGLILAAVATARLETFPERRAGVVRTLVAAFVVQQCFFLFGGWFSTATGRISLSAWMPGLTSSLPVLTYPVLLLLFAACVFCTGELRPAEARQFGAYLARGWTPRGMMRGRLNSALPYMLCLLGAVIGLYALSFVLTGQAMAIGSGTTGASAAFTVPTAPPPSTSYPPGFAGTPPAAKPQAPQAPRGGFLPVCITLVATVVGLWSLGLLISVVVRSRWASLALMVAVLLTIVVAPALSHAAWASDYEHRPPGMTINLYYLNPVIGILQLSEPPDQALDKVPLAAEGVPIWMVTSVAYAMIAGLCILVALPLVASVASRRTAEHDDLAATV